MPHKHESPLLPDGYRGSFYCWDAQSQPGDCLLYLHGIESHAGWFLQSAEKVNAMGWSVVFAERRGSGRNKQGRGHASSHKRLLADVFFAAGYCRDRWPNRRVHLAGVSWGGKLALGAVIKRPELFASLTMIAPGLFPRVDLNGKEKSAVLFNRLFMPKAGMSVPLEDAKLFTDNPERIAFIEQDELRLREVSASFFWASYRLDRLIQARGNRVAVPVHLMLSGRDRIIDSDRTREWFESCSAPEKKLSEFPDSAHTLVFAEDNGSFLRALADWLAEKAQSGEEGGTAWR